MRKVLEVEEEGRGVKGKAKMFCVFLES